MGQRLHKVQGAQCYVLLNKLCPSAVVSVYSPNALPTQRLDDLCVTHQDQVTCRSLSYEVSLFSSATVTGETLNYSKRFAVVQDEGPAKGLFDKKSSPPPPYIQNSTAPPSAPGNPIEDGVFNASNQAEYIYLVRNQGMEVDYDMELPP